MSSQIDQLESPAYHLMLLFVKTDAQVLSVAQGKPSSKSPLREPEVDEAAGVAVAGFLVAGFAFCFFGVAFGLDTST